MLTHLDGIGMAAVVEPDGTWAPAFPDATLVVTATERAHIAGSTDEAVTGATAFEALARSGHVRAVDPPHELAPDVILVASGGHSPGHAVVVIGPVDRPAAVLLGHLALNPVHLDAPPDAASPGRLQPKPWVMRARRASVG